jgi:hypothetical protein
MGQPITVTVRAGVRPEVMHFELNRSLTGMQIERYRSPEDVVDSRPPDELARRLFVLGVTGVTIYSSVVTVTAPADRWEELRGKVEDTIANLFIYYREGAPAPAAVSAAGAEAPATPVEASTTPAEAAPAEAAPAEAAPAEAASTEPEAAPASS